MHDCQILKFSNSTDLYQNIIKDVFLLSQNFQNIGLSGGSSPRRLYELMTIDQRINWLKFSFFQVDERFVGSESPDSNQKMITHAFGYNSQLLSQFQPFDVSQNSSQDNSQNILKSIEQYSIILPKNGLDVCFLGFGIDGHFASIFPADYWENQNQNTPEQKDKIEGFKQLLESQNKVLHTISKPPYLVPDRLTLSPQYILKSQKIVVILIGKEKKAILQAFEDNILESYEFPANFLHNHKNLVFYCCFE